MAHINNAVALAVGAGWNQNKPPYEHSFVTANRYWITMRDANGSEYTLAVQVAYCDPIFWQALGKKLGYYQNYEDVPNHSEGDDILCWCQPEQRAEEGELLTVHRDKTWRGPWHLFIEHLADGKDAEIFFKELLA